MKSIDDLADEMTGALGLDEDDAAYLKNVLTGTLIETLDSVETELLDAARRYEPDHAEALVVGGGVAVDAVRSLLRGETFTHDEQARAAVLARFTAAARADERAKVLTRADTLADEWIDKIANDDEFMGADLKGEPGSFVAQLRLRLQ